MDDAGKEGGGQGDSQWSLIETALSASPDLGVASSNQLIMIDALQHAAIRDSRSAAHLDTLLQKKAVQQSRIKTALIVARPRCHTKCLSKLFAHYKMLTSARFYLSVVAALLAFQAGASPIARRQDDSQTQVQSAVDAIRANYNQNSKDAAAFCVSFLESTGGGTITVPVQVGVGKDVGTSTDSGGLGLGTGGGLTVNVGQSNIGVGTGVGTGLAGAGLGLGSGLGAGVGAGDGASTDVTLPDFLKYYGSQVVEQACSLIDADPVASITSALPIPTAGTSTVTVTSTKTEAAGTQTVTQTSTVTDTITQTKTKTKTKTATVTQTQTNTKTVTQTQTKTKTSTVTATPTHLINLPKIKTVTAFATITVHA